MPRDIPVGNGQLLVTFDHQYQLRDLYFPHVGQENHAGAGPCRFGVYTTLPGRSDEKLAWTTEDGWEIRQRYLRDTLTTSVSLDHKDLKLSLYCNDTVDFHRPILIRRIKINNHAAEDRLVRILHHQDFNMFGTKMGDTAYYDPELQAIVHYRGKRYLMAGFYDDCKPCLAEYATGASGFHGAEGTWRDAEDGHLQGNAIAQGAVDSTIACHVSVPGGGQKVVYMVVIAAQSREQLLELHKWLANTTPQGVIDRTSSYWRLWIGATSINFGNLPSNVVELFKRSLLVVRTQIDNGGAIVAANDSDIMQFARDTYSYVWPRDGALVADALDMAGFPDLARWFYSFCSRTIAPEGYFHHKYNPDGSPASSWHPWVLKGSRVLPIQEDETALVVWAMWRHYYQYRDIEFIRPLWVDVVQKAADFMVDYRDPRTGLPLPSYDLWEERWGVHAFTVASVYGGLKAAHNFAVCFGDRVRAEKYQHAAEELKAGAARHLYNEHLGRFVRRLIPKDRPEPMANPAGGVSEPAAVSAKPSTGHEPETSDLFDIDEILDAALWAIQKFHLFEADDPRVEATMNAVEQKLWIKTAVGGVARYENDYYHRVSDDIASVPGNPWFICTLWLADYFIARANTPAELKRALPVLEWVAHHALPSGVLAEQVHPHTNEPISVSPLTWSHATVVSTVMKYLQKLEQLQRCRECRQPIFRLHRAGAVELNADAHFDRLEAAFQGSEQRDVVAATAGFSACDAAGDPITATLAIDTRDCIGCEVCVAHCAQGVLRMVDGKAMIDLRHLNDCDLDGQCVEVCPVNVVSLRVHFADPVMEPAA